jgi:hypothetical protein
MRKYRKHGKKTKKKIKNTLERKRTKAWLFHHGAFLPVRFSSIIGCLSATDQFAKTSRFKMIDKEFNYEIFRQVAPAFHKFLDDPSNSKIVFSGRYGAGKTTFLNTFFGNPSVLGIAEHGYELFRISPVNYSIASNSDIIEAIKYDVITELLQKPHIEILTSDILSYQLLSEKDTLTVFETVLAALAAKGIALDKIWEKLKQLKTVLDERKQALDEGDTFTTFLNRLEDQVGIFQHDLVTKFLEHVLKRLKAAGKVPVLLIDDFDRLDPDHIFRILNVFSAHFDEELFARREAENKFEFSKVILVCDIGNIRSLFHVRYGQEADFTGYMDKFYNRIVFEFNVYQEVKQFFRSLLYTMDKNLVGNYRQELSYFDRNNDELLQQTILYSILNGTLTFRSLLRIRGFHVTNHYEKLSSGLGYAYRGAGFSLFQLYLNFFLFGGVEGFNRLYETCKKRINRSA